MRKPVKDVLILDINSTTRKLIFVKPSIKMSISDSDSQYLDDVTENESIPDQDSDVGSAAHINNRGDRYSDESSGYHLSLSADPTAKNKKNVRRINPETNKQVKVEFFPTTTTPNSAIKNAVSGSYQTTSENRVLRVGTRDEDLFFSVILATGELGQDAPTLFYDNPEQYERHFMTKLSPEIKDAWIEKRDSAIIRLKTQKRILDRERAAASAILVK